MKADVSVQPLQSPINRNIGGIASTLISQSPRCGGIANINDSSDQRPQSSGTGGIELSDKIKRRLFRMERRSVISYSPLMKEELF